MQVLKASDKHDAKTPLVNSPCKCHYRGRVVTGEEFDSSYKRGSPATFAPNQVIRGWTEAMQLMKEGDKWELYVPSELAYGESQRGKLIKPGSMLIFELELLEVGEAKNMCACVCTHVWRHVCMNACMYGLMNGTKNVCMMCVCVCARARSCVCVYAHICTHTHTRTHTHTHTHTHIICNTGR